MYQKKNRSKDDANWEEDPSPPQEESDEEEDDEDDDDMDLDRTAASQEHGEQECDGTSVPPGEDEQGVAERDGPAASHGAQLSIAAPITPGTPPSATQQSSSQGGSSLQTGELESLSHSKPSRIPRGIRSSPR